MPWWLKDFTQSARNDFITPVCCMSRRDLARVAELQVLHTRYSFSTALHYNIYIFRSVFNFDNYLQDITNTWSEFERTIAAANHLHWDSGDGFFFFILLQSAGQTVLGLDAELQVQGGGGGGAEMGTSERYERLDLREIVWETPDTWTAGITNR